jgi:hypothetical protein
LKGISPTGIKRGIFGILEFGFGGSSCASTSDGRKKRRVKKMKIMLKRRRNKLCAIFRFDSDAEIQKPKRFVKS